MGTAMCNPCLEKFCYERKRELGSSRGAHGIQGGLKNGK